MTFKQLLLVLALISNQAFAQDSIKMTNSYGAENAELQDLMDFEGIYIETLNFESGKFELERLYHGQRRSCRR